MSTDNQKAASGYQLPPAKGHWDACQSPDFVPTPNQQLVVNAVQAALDAGLYYSNAVRDHCAQSLGLTQGQSEANYHMRVEGGIFGMDCYYARRYLDAVRYRAKEDEVRKRLKPYTGQKLGTLMFNDFKRVTGAVILEVDQDIKLQGSRGSLNVGFLVQASAIESAIDRAASKGLRKDNFEQFCLPANPQPNAVATNDCEPALF